MNWTDFIPPVTLLAVVYAAGQHVADSRAVRRELASMREDMKESAKGQGQRLGALEDRTKVLEDFRARSEGAAERERDLSGVVRR